MEIVQCLRQRYLQFLQVVVDVLTDEVSYRDFEDRLRQELDALGRDIVKWVVESCDERLREEPQARPGWVVARRGDEKQLLTPLSTPKMMFLKIVGAMLGLPQFRCKAAAGRRSFLESREPLCDRLDRGFAVCGDFFDASV